MIDSAVTAAAAACGFEDALPGEVLRWMLFPCRCRISRIITERRYQCLGPS